MDDIYDDAEAVHPSNNIKPSGRNIKPSGRNPPITSRPPISAKPNKLKNVWPPPKEPDSSENTDDIYDEAENSIARPRVGTVDKDDYDGYMVNNGLDTRKSTFSSMNRNNKNDNESLNSNQRERSSTSNNDFKDSIEQRINMFKKNTDIKTPPLAKPRPTNLPPVVPKLPKPNITVPVMPKKPSPSPSSLPPKPCLAPAGIAQKPFIPPTGIAQKPFIPPTGIAQKPHIPPTGAPLKPSFVKPAYNPPKPLVSSLPTKQEKTVAHNIPLAGNDEDGEAIYDCAEYVEPSDVDYSDSLYMVEAPVVIAQKPHIPLTGAPLKPSAIKPVYNQPLPSLPTKQGDTLTQNIPLEENEEEGEAIYDCAENVGPEEDTYLYSCDSLYMVEDSPTIDPNIENKPNFNILGESPPAPPKPQKTFETIDKIKLALPFGLDTWLYQTINENKDELLQKGMSVEFFQNLCTMNLPKAGTLRVIDTDIVLKSPTGKSEKELRREKKAAEKAEKEKQKKMEKDLKNFNLDLNEERVISGYASASSECKGTKKDLQYQTGDEIVLLKTSHECPPGKILAQNQLSLRIGYILKVDFGLNELNMGEGEKRVDLIPTEDDDEFEESDYEDSFTPVPPPVPPTPRPGGALPPLPVKEEIYAECDDAMI